MQEALEYMRSNAHPHHHHHHSGDSDDDLDLAEGLKPDWQDQVWGLQEAEAYKVTHPGCCLIVVDDCVVDATKYLGDHVRVVPAWLISLILTRALFGSLAAALSFAGIQSGQRHRLARILPGGTQRGHFEAD